MDILLLYIGLEMVLSDSELAAAATVLWRRLGS